MTDYVRFCIVVDRKARKAIGYTCYEYRNPDYVAELDLKTVKDVPELPIVVNHFLRDLLREELRPQGICASKRKRREKNHEDELSLSA